MLFTKELKRKLSCLEHGVHASEMFSDDDVHELLQEVLEHREEVSLDLD